MYSCSAKHGLSGETPHPCMQGTCTHKVVYHITARSAAIASSAAQDIAALPGERGGH
jgi:hypothetical protein